MRVRGRDEAGRVLIDVGAPDGRVIFDGQGIARIAAFVGGARCITSVQSTRPRPARRRASNETIRQECRASAPVSRRRSRAGAGALASEGRRCWRVASHNSQHSDHRQRAGKRGKVEPADQAHVANVNPPSAQSGQRTARRLSASASTARAPSNMLTGTRLNRFSGVAISTKAAAMAPTGICRSSANPSTA